MDKNEKNQVSVSIRYVEDLDYYEINIENNEKTMLVFVNEKGLTEFLIDAVDNLPKLKKGEMFQLQVLEHIKLEMNLDKFKTAAKVIHGTMMGFGTVTFSEGSVVMSMEREETVYIYLPKNKISIFENEEITNACGDFMEAMGFEMKTEEEPIFKSLWKKIIFSFKKKVNETDFDDLFEKGKKALELKNVDLPTAEQTEKLANSAEKINSIMEKYDEGVIRLGAILYLKKVVNGKTKIIIQQLSFPMIKLLDEKPQLLQNPQTIYELLTGDVKKAVNESESTSTVVPD